MSHIPTNYAIKFSHDYCFKLLVAEYLGDSVKRFFLAAGGRLAYIDDLKIDINNLFSDCFITKYNSYLLELLPTAIQTICE